MPTIEMLNYHLINPGLAPALTLNVVRDWIKEGFQPAALFTSKGLIPYDYETHRAWAEAPRVLQTGVMEVYYHPMQMRRLLGIRSTDWWCTRVMEVQSFIEDATDRSISYCASPPADVHHRLRTLGDVQGTLRKRTRLLHFDAIAHMIASLAEPYDVAHAAAGLKRVLKVVGQLEVAYPEAPPLPEDLFSGIQAPVPNDIHPRDNADLFNSLYDQYVKGGLPISVIYDLYNIGPQQPVTSQVRTNDSLPPLIPKEPLIPVRNDIDFTGMEERRIRETIANAQKELDRRRDQAWVDARIVRVEYNEHGHPRLHLLRDGDVEPTIFEALPF